MHIDPMTRQYVADPWDFPPVPPMQAAAPMQQKPASAAAVQQGGKIWVRGRQEAESYPIAQNTAVDLWDSTAPVVYLKQADASGRPTLEAYDLVKRPETAQEAREDAGAGNYPTREEFEALTRRLAALEGKFAPKPKRRRVEEEDEDE